MTYQTRWNQTYLLTVRAGKKQVKKTGLFWILFLFSACNVLAGDYVIGDGDTLQISVWGSQELSLETTVRPDGKISVPALGDIKASGLTPMELKSILEKEMARMVKAPVVTVILSTITNYKIFVTGRGLTPVVVTLTRETTLLEFLSQVGSLENADLQHAYLLRNKKIIKHGLLDLFEKGDFSQDVILQPDDMLFVPDNFEKRINIIGEVETPTTIPYRDGLTIVDAILAAEGFTEFAKESDVIILRKVKEEKMIASSDERLNYQSKPVMAENTSEKRIKISVNAEALMKKGDMTHNVPIMPGDIIVVREGFF
jgi:polysaccharide export outer membrane protein